MPKDAMMKIGEAAQYLGISPNTLKVWAARRQVPLVKLGPKTLRFRRSDLDAWLDAKTIQPGK